MRPCISLPPPVCDCSLQNALYPQSAAIFHKTKMPVKCSGIWVLRHNSGAHQSIILKLAMLLTTLPLSCIFLLFCFLIFQSLIIIFNYPKWKQIFSYLYFFVIGKKWYFSSTSVLRISSCICFSTLLNSSLLSHFPYLKENSHLSFPVIILLYSSWSYLSTLKITLNIRDYGLLNGKT